MGHSFFLSLCRTVCTFHSKKSPLCVKHLKFSVFLSHILSIFIFYMLNSTFVSNTFGILFFFLLSKRMQKHFYKEFSFYTSTIQLVGMLFRFIWVFFLCFILLPRIELICLNAKWTQPETMIVRNSKSKRSKWYKNQICTYSIKRVIAEQQQQLGMSETVYFSKSFLTISLSFFLHCIFYQFPFLREPKFSMVLKLLQKYSILFFLAFCLYTSWRKRRNKKLWRMATKWWKNDTKL